MYVKALVQLCYLDTPPPLSPNIISDLLTRNCWKRRGVTHPPSRGAIRTILAKQTKLYYYTLQSVRSIKRFPLQDYVYSSASLVQIFDTNNTGGSTVCFKIYFYDSQVEAPGFYAPLSSFFYPPRHSGTSASVRVLIPLRQ